MLLVLQPSRDVRAQTDAPPAQVVPQGPLANDENKTPSPKGNADTTEPSTSPEAQNQPYRKWIDTQRETTVVEQIDHCIALAKPAPDLAADSPADVSRRERGAKCYRAAADLLDQGLAYQTCQWGEPSQTSCAPLGPHEVPPNSETRALLRSQGEELRKALLGASKDNVDDLPRQIRDLRAQLSRIVARHQGGATLVSQGGVSLGSWQAGLLYLVTEWEKQRARRRFQEQDEAARASNLQPAPTPFRTAAFETVTGASAGAVNGLVAAVESCRWLDPSPPAPNESLYYQVWIESLGLFGRDGNAGLFPTDKMPSGKLGIFNKDGALKVALNKAAQYIADGYLRSVPECKVDFGFSVTHLNLTSSPVLVDPSASPDASTPVLSRTTLRKKFAVQLNVSNRCADDTGADAPQIVRRAQQQLCIKNIEPAASGDELLPLQQKQFYAGLGDKERQVSLQTLLEGVTASGAFPIAFPPVPLAFTQYTPTANGDVTATPAKATFVDGGTLDNTPIGLAAAIDSWRPPQSSNPYLRDLLPTAPKTYIFVDPNVTSWHAFEPEPDPEKDGGVVTTVLKFAGDFVTSSSDAEFLDNARQLPFMRRLKDDWVGSRLGLPRRRMPITGSGLGHFMAFLEKDFRIYDYYVGMADALVYLRHEERLLYNTTTLVDALDQKLRQRDALYACMRAYYTQHQLDSGEHDPNVAHSAPLRAPLLSQHQLPAECRAQGPVLQQATGLSLTESDAQHIDAETWEPYDAYIEAVKTGVAPNKAAERTLTAYNFRALLVAMHNFKIWTQTDEYNPDKEFSKFFELLGEAPATPCDEKAECTDGGYVFVDLEAWNQNHKLIAGSRMTASQAKTAFRHMAQIALNEFADAQPSISETLIRIAGRPAADLGIERTFPDVVVGVGYSQQGVEVSLGRGMTDGSSAHLRWDLGVRAFRIGLDELDQDFAPFHITGSLFTRFSLVVPTTSWLDLEAAANANLEQVWEPQAPRDHAFPGGGLGLGGTLSGVLLQRVYLALEYQFRRKDLSWQATPYRDTVVPLLRRHEFAGSFGWRWLW